MAVLINELDSVSRRLKNLLPELVALEHDSRALATAKALDVGADLTAPQELEWPDGLEHVEARFGRLGEERG